jgi:tetratricopeptide (TPR) repeat protein
MTNRRNRTLVIRRDDHIGDAIGLVFLETPETAAETIIERLREYLGPRVKILKAEISREQIEVEIEARGWTEESTRMAAAARDLFLKGGRRNALAMFQEAIALDPLCAEAMTAYGMSLVEQEADADGLQALRRARELGAGSVAMLMAMARAAARLERRGAAIGYLEAVLELEPKNFAARRAMKAMGRTPRASAQTARAARDRSR